MTIRTIEVQCYVGLDLASLLDAAPTLARPLGAHIEACYVLPDAAAELGMLPPASMGADMLTVPAIEKIVDDIVGKNPDKVADAKTNPKAIGWFVGQVMKASGGKANPQAVNDLLKKRLGV